MTASASMVYVACAESARIEVHSLEADGRLRHCESVPVPGVEGPSEISMPVAVSGDRRFLYVAVRQPPYPLCSFGISAGDGSLFYLGTTSTPDSIPHLTLDPGSTHLLCASAEKGLVVSVRIDEGVAGSIESTIELGHRGHCVRSHPALPVVYAAGHVSDLVHWAVFDSRTGELRHAGTVAAPDGSHPRHLEVSADGARLYVLNEADASVSIFDVDAVTGALSAGATVDSGIDVAGTLAADLHLSPDGRTLYTSERTTNLLLGYRVTAEGLEPVSATPTEDWTRSFALEPEGEFLIAAGQRSGHLSVYAVGSDDGKLTRLSRYACGPNPSWIEVIRLPTQRG
jgi:6-phosphogluconolactonase